MSEPKRIDWVNAQSGPPSERPNWCSRCIRVESWKDDQAVKAYLEANPGLRLGGQLYRDVAAARLGRKTPNEGGYRGGPNCEACHVRERDDRDRKAQERYTQQAAGGGVGGVVRQERKEWKR